MYVLLRFVRTVVVMVFSWTVKFITIDAGAAPLLLLLLLRLAKDKNGWVWFHGLYMRCAVQNTLENNSNNNNNKWFLSCIPDGNIYGSSHRSSSSGSGTIAGGVDCKWNTKQAYINYFIQNGWPNNRSIYAACILHIERSKLSFARAAATTGPWFDYYFFLFRRWRILH